MILVMTKTEIDKRSGVKVTVVSHGIDLDTDRMQVLPQVRPEEIGATYDPDIGEFVLLSEEEKREVKDSMRLK